MRNLDFTKINTGLIGDVINEIHPLIESNKESLIIQLLTCFGNCIGRNPYFLAGSDKHFGNLFVLLVGRSSRGRKGQSFNIIKNLFEDIDTEWTQNNLAKGLSSSEGLIYRIRDDVEIDDDSGVQINRGVIDKRLLCVESEFSSVLRQSQRDGNTLSQIIRDAWDSLKLATLTKNSPLVVTDPMISIIGHITIAELLKCMSQTDMQNGFSNRFIFIKAEADKLLPDPPQMNQATKSLIVAEIKKSIEEARKIGRVEFDSDKTRQYWNDYYLSVNQVDASLVGALTSREEPQIRRLAMIIALFNRKESIDLDSLMFAIEIFRYSKDSLHEVYGKSTGDNFSDKILDLLNTFPEGLSRSEINNYLSRNYPKTNLDRTLNFLKMQKLADFKKNNDTGGRPQEVWFLL